MDIGDQIANYVFDMPDEDMRPRYTRVIDILEILRRDCSMCDLFSSKLKNEWGMLARGIQNLIDEVKPKD